MDLHEAFISSIAESLYDDAPRLIYADWLDDHGQPERAEFIRVQCELEPMRDRYEIDRAAELHRRENELLSDHKGAWLGPGMEGWGNWGWGTWGEDGAYAEFRRGFVDFVSMPARTFLALGEKVRRQHPTIRRVVLFRVNGYGEQLAASPALEGLAELELACWYSDADAEAIASSPYLGSLQVLELWLGRNRPLTDGRLCRIMAGSKAWPKLRELTLLNVDAENQSRGETLAKTANEVAGRKVAVFRRGYPDLFPFAPDFWYTFPGYLPNGRMAMAAEDHSTSPPTLCVVTFDKKGRQTKDVLRVPVPEDLLAIPVDNWYEHKDRMKQQLIDKIGFRPGFIRIRGCELPARSTYINPSWDYEECIGCLDTDDDAETNWEDYPCGFGGRVAYLVRAGQWVAGWDRYADKRGRVHST
jgi:uncharacterized protein (TIGR02996 family)